MKTKILQALLALSCLFSIVSCTYDGMTMRQHDLPASSRLKLTDKQLLGIDSHGRNYQRDWFYRPGLFEAGQFVGKAIYAGLHDTRPVRYTPQQGRNNFNHFRATYPPNPSRHLYRMTPPPTSAPATPSSAIWGSPACPPLSSQANTPSPVVSRLKCGSRSSTN